METEASLLPLPSTPTPSGTCSGTLPRPLPPPLATCCLLFAAETRYQTVAPVDGAHAGDAVVVAHSLRQEPVPDLPGKHGGVLAFVIGDLVDHFGSSNLWFGSPDHPGADTACFIVPTGQSTEHIRGFLTTSFGPFVSFAFTHINIRRINE